MSIKFHDRDIYFSKRKVCDICKEPIEGEENNAWPVLKNGICCDECYFDTVLPARIDRKSKQTPVKDSLKDLNMLINSEKQAIDDYTMAINNAGDGIELEIYKEILQDEKDHLEKLNALLKGYDNSKVIQ